MRNANARAIRGNARAWAPMAILLGMITLGGSPGGLCASPQDPLRAVTDRMTYNAGEQVKLRIISPLPQVEPEAPYRFAVRYAGEQKVVAGGLALEGADGHAAIYHVLWKIPMAARAGRYEIDMREQDPSTQKVIQEIPQIASFVVHHQALRIITAEVEHPYYTSGDPIGCVVRIENLSGQTLSGLSVEFSERYWPWITQQRERVGTAIEKLQSDITLKPHLAWQFNSSRCAEAPKVEQPSIKQFGAVVWDHARKNVYAIAFTPLVFINPPGVDSPHPYPPQYDYPKLEAVNTSSYRQFHPEPFGVDAIRFDSHHTMYASGAEAKVRFSLSNPTDSMWRQVSVQAWLASPEGKKLAERALLEHTDLNPHGPVLRQEVSFSLPQNQSGLYHVWVQIADEAGRTVASNDLELGVNPLPLSAMVFCAHEDDDGTQMGFIRALVENQIPLHMVYYTSGDAGSCDRYFQHSCGPVEALNFGYIRMQEARAAMGHLGVAPENILFLGLPDGGSGKIWYDHLNASDPYLAVLLASDHAPYECLFRPNLPYARDAVVEATEEIIRRYQPEVIFTVHPPAEGHIDHIVNNYFVVKALQALARAGSVSPELELRVDRIFNPKEHPATPYHYEDHEFYVSGEAMARAQEAGWFYQSQGGNRAEVNLRDWDQLRRTEGYRKVLDWKEHEGWNEKE